MNTKLKEELVDLAHLLHQAIITDDDRFAEAALADMTDALASMKKVVGCGFGVVGSTNNSQLKTHNPSLSRCTFKLLRADTMATMVMHGDPEEPAKPLVAHIRKIPNAVTAEIFRDGDMEPLVDLTVHSGFDRAKRVAQGAMRGLMSSLGHKHRQRQNKRDRKANSEE